MPSDRSRHDDDEDDDRPRRKRRDDDSPRRRRRHDDDDDDDGDGPRRGGREKSGTGLVVAIVLGSILAVGVIAVAIVAARQKKSRESDDTATAGGGPVLDNRRGGNAGPAFDEEGLPLGNDLDSVLVRMNRRYQQNDYFRYQMEFEYLRLLKKPEFTRGGEVFRAMRGHAGTPLAVPQIGTIPFAAWQQMLVWASKDEVPELCRMLVSERIAARQSDIFGKLASFKDPRCAETIAPFLASPERRNAAETLLKELGSSAERFVLPYLRANYDKDTRVAALQVVAQIGTKESARVVEGMTRDADLMVNLQAKTVFEKLSKAFGIEHDLQAVIKALKDGIAAQNPLAINDSSDQLDNAYRADHPMRAEIFQGLIECCKVNDPKGYGKRASFVGALKWSSKDDVGALCDLLIASGGESVVFLKLKEYKDPKCADTVAAFLTLPLKSGEAADVLKVLGAPAEKAVIPYAMRVAPNGAAIPFATRSTAIELLGDIGTGDCVPLLRQLAAEAAVQPIANKAIAKVLARKK